MPRYIASADLPSPQKVYAPFSAPERPVLEDRLLIAKYLQPITKTTVRRDDDNAVLTA